MSVAWQSRRDTAQGHESRAGTLRRRMRVALGHCAGAWESRWDTAQVPLRCAAAASESWLLRVTQDFCDNKVQELAFLSCFVFYFSFNVCYVCLYFAQYEMVNFSLNCEKFPESYLTVHQTTSYQTAAVFFTFSFVQNVRCTLTHKVLWQLRVPPCSLINNHAVTAHIPSLKTIICVSCRRHFTF